MKLIVHGAANEVGRSCIELVTDDSTRFLLDAGIKLSETGTEFPLTVENPSGISAVFVSHAHLDHTGYLPLLDHNGMKCPIFATSPTKALTKILLADAFKIGRLKHQPLGYEEENIEKALSFTRRIKIDDEGSIGKAKFEYFDAGHIPGSSYIHVQVDGKRILYTGDINTNETRLLNGAETDYPKDVDVLITEATYGDREHPPRQNTEKEFLNEAEETIEKGGSVLVPVFAVGRAQEIMLLLSKENLGVPVYLDGMAKEATELLLNYPKSIKNAAELRDAYEKVRFVKGSIQRKNIANKQGIFVTTSGMVTGGPVMDYLSKLGTDPRNSILLTGYQGEHTNGRMLLETGSVFIDGWKTKISANYKQFDFSAHAGQNDLKKLIKGVNPGKLVFNHGDPGAINALHEWADIVDIRSYAPKIGDKITF
ncbi:hypothetical protein COV19_07485 [Candidatus Woesearchaeota archaeon CG10_big_fil_rev_8_21_14_0_10_44_13]|nr:MAG: hypothetical protein COV19_07485 [Candidatus Woesearchaeota archaeon CG10_big_fil_rev_8_21_14_0_10_44_13]